MIYKSFHPSPALKEFVRNYTLAHFQFKDAQAIPSKHRPPKPEQGLVFYLKGFVNQHNLTSGSQQIPATVSLFSHQTDKKLLQVSSEFFMFTIFFHPGILHRLIGIPSIELNQQYHDAESFFGTEVRTVREQLAEAKCHASMISIVENFLLYKFNRMKLASPIDIVANLLLSDPTCFTLDEVARQACLSTKQFYRKFVERIGLSPKFFSRLTRFNHAFRYKTSHYNASWSSIAQEFCYTDYHHLEKEFKEFTGLTPNDWLKQDKGAPERILQLR